MAVTRICLVNAASDLLRKQVSWTIIIKKATFVNTQYPCIKNYLLPAFAGNIFAVWK